MSEESETMTEPARPWGELFALTIDRFSETVEGMHDAIVQPWFRHTGPAGMHVGAAYAATTTGVYRSVRAVASLAGRISDSVRTGSSTDPTPRSDAVQAFANAVWGDELARRDSAMAVGLGVRDREGFAVELETDSLERAFPEAAGRVVVLLHGLGQTERCFSASDTVPGLVEALALSSFTPVPVRYNSGRSVADTGEELAGLLDELIEHWPVRVTEIALVGYSMGGLVARAAAASGHANDSRWVDAVRHVVTVAAPHSGSPIEKAVVAAERSLMVAPQTRPLGRFLRQRSAGIRDLRSGSDLPASFDGIKHHLIGAVITSDATHPVGSLFGDLIVRPASATGPGLVAHNRHLIGGLRHFDILHEPTVAARILEWIEFD